jgi:hypothetical protein
MALICFFYGNGIPLDMAIQLLHACDVGTDALITEQFSCFYDIRKNSKDDVHMGMYFNINVNKFVFINGSNKNQLEIVDFLDNDMEDSITMIHKTYKTE